MEAPTDPGTQKRLASCLLPSTWQVLMDTATTLYPWPPRGKTLCAAAVRPPGSSPGTLWVELVLLVHSGR